MEDTELKKFISDIKRDLLFHLITNIREKKTTFGSAKYLAKDFLHLLPASSKEAVMNNLYSLTGVYPEAKIVFAKYIGQVEEEKTQHKLYKIREYMQQGNYEYAVQAAKGVI